MLKKSFLDQAFCLRIPLPVPFGCPVFSASERHLRPYNKVECFPWPLVSGEPYILPLLVVSDSSHVAQKDSSFIWDNTRLPYLMRLGVRRYQASVAFLCWVGGCKTFCNHVPLPVLGLPSWFVFLFPPYRALFQDASSIIL